MTVNLFFFPVVGLVLPAPENLRVDIWDGEATAHWSHPTNAPAGFHYNVEMAMYVRVPLYLFLFSFTCFLIEMQSYLFICIIQENLLTFISLHLFCARRYTDEWKKVDYCTDIMHTYCNLSSLIHDYNIGYKVKVQLVVGANASAWIRRKFLPNTSRCGEKSAPKTLQLWLVVLLSFIFTHHFSCRQTAASILYFMAYVQLSDSFCPPKTHFT